MAGALRGEGAAAGALNAKTVPRQAAKDSIVTVPVPVPVPGLITGSACRRETHDAARWRAGGLL